MKKRFLISFTLLFVAAVLFLPLPGKSDKTGKKAEVNKKVSVKSSAKKDKRNVSRSKFNKKKFDVFMKQTLADWKVPGAAVGIIHKGRLLLARGYGYRDVWSKKPVTPDTLFYIGSTTKAITACALGMMVDDGKMEWDKPVRQYLPDFKMSDSYISLNLTPRDLLNHCTGLPRHELVWYGDTRSRKEICRVLRYLDFSIGFRSRFQYQNLTYIAAGYLLGQLNRSTWEAVVKDRILEPLGMNSTNFSLKATKNSSDFAVPYGGWLKESKRMHFYEDGGAGAPAGGINSNIKDMLHWVRLNLQKGKWQGKQLIKPYTMQQLHSPQVIALDEITAMYYSFRELSYPTYAMGWFVYQYRGRKILQHTGNINGFSALVSMMPDTGTGIVVLTNKNGSHLPNVTAFHIYDLLLGLTPPPWSKRFLKTLEKHSHKEGNEDKGQQESSEEKEKNTDTNPPTHQLKRFLGTFQHPAYGSITIKKKEEGLYADFKVLSGMLKHSNYNIFVLDNGMGSGTKIQFHIDENGSIGSVSMPLEPSIDRIVFKRISMANMLSKDFLMQFTGRYMIENFALKVYLKENNRLMVQAQGQQPLEMMHYDDLSFKLKKVKGYHLKFYKKEDGTILKMVVHRPKGKMVAYKQYPDEEECPDATKEKKEKSKKKEKRKEKRVESKKEKKKQKNHCPGEDHSNHNSCDCKSGQTIH